MSASQPTMIVLKGQLIQPMDSQFTVYVHTNGTQDFGNIDRFELLSEGYYIGGEWGEVIIDSEPPMLELSE